MVRIFWNHIFGFFVIVLYHFFAKVHPLLLFVALFIYLFIFQFVKWPPKRNPIPSFLIRALLNQ